jgi:hypothetical protein
VACLVLGLGFVLRVLFRMRLRLSLILLCCGWGLLVVLLKEVVEGGIAAVRSWLGVGLRRIDGALGVVGADIEARRGKGKGQEETAKDIAV